MLHGVAEADAGYRYAPGKWSIREVVGHISDAERIYHRALAFARGDTTSLPRYDPDGYVEMAGFDHRTIPLPRRRVPLRPLQHDLLLRTPRLRI